MFSAINSKSRNLHCKNGASKCAQEQKHFCLMTSCLKGLSAGYLSRLRLQVISPGSTQRPTCELHATKLQEMKKLAKRNSNYMNYTKVIQKFLKNSH